MNPFSKNRRAGVTWLMQQLVILLDDMIQPDVELLMAYYLLSPLMATYRVQGLGRGTVTLTPLLNVFVISSSLIITPTQNLEAS